jgi:hypothetical protein
MKRKLNSPSQIAAVLYTARTTAFVYRKASSELPIKLTDKMPRATLNLNPGLPDENVQVSYRVQWPMKRMDRMTATKRMNCFRDGMVTKFYELSIL